jgi:2-oxoglutarate dehydrogenase E2 component (dihydrolipoamide succinyltransferase)
VADIVVPKLNNNDTTYTLVDWLFADGQEVPAGEPVVVVETSKAAEELLCVEGGVLHQLLPVASECRPGEVIGRLFASEQERQHVLDGLAAETPPVEPATTLVITDAARELARRHGIDDDRLRGLGQSAIKSTDVERLIAEDGRGALDTGSDRRLLPIGRAQQAVADVVSESHSTIPAAFVLAKVEVDAALAAAREASERHGGMIGLPELLVKAVAGLHEGFPAFFASFAGDALAVVDPPRIGVTMDVGQGLSIPVLPDVRTMSLPDLAVALMDLRAKAVRGGFREHDFTGAAIVVTLNNDRGIVFATPIVFPGQTCMVSVGATMVELTLADDGSPRARRVAHVGVAYDHRAINGRDAARFLLQLRKALESPAGLVGDHAPLSASEPTREMESRLT